MPTINTDFSAYAAQQADAAEKKRTELGQDAFLKLMTSQLQNQDPLKPLDGNEFMGQLAQFSTVKGIENLQTAFANVAAALTEDQSLKGAALIGRTALIPADTARLGDAVEGQPRGLDGAVFADGPGSIEVEISDAGGQIVKRIQMPANEAGDVDFHWDGTDAAGNPVAAGEYRFKANFIDSSGSSTAAVPMLAGRVDSVLLSSQGLILNLAGIGQIPLAGVRRFS